jgi:hypothetical protein
LLVLRRSSEALRRGHYRLDPATDQHTLVYSRVSGKQHLLVALNLTPEPREVNVLHGRIVLSTTLHRDRESVRRSLRLEPDEGVVIEREGG